MTEVPGVVVQTQIQQGAGAGVAPNILAIVGGAATSPSLMTVINVRNYNDAVSKFGSSTAYGDVTEMCRAAFREGASQIKVVVAATGALPTSSNYQDGLDALLNEDNVSAVAVDAITPLVASYLKDHVEESIYPNQRERRGFICPGATATTVANFTALAVSAVSNFVIIPGNLLKDTSGNTLRGGVLAAKFAQVDLNELNDPTLPLHTLPVANGYSGAAIKWTDADLDNLILAGVSPVETRLGQTTIVRAVTTQIPPAADNKVVEATDARAILVIQSEIRNLIKNGFKRAKNSPSVRQQIQNVILSKFLEYQKREIVATGENYPVEITVEQDSLDVTKINITVSYYRVVPLNFINITFTFNL